MDELKECQQQFLKSKEQMDNDHHTFLFECKKYGIHCKLSYCNSENVPVNYSVKEKEHMEKFSILSACKRHCPEQEGNTDGKN